jgi:RNA polymerase sigma-70 factor (ECF subfamily)
MKKNSDHIFDELLVLKCQAGDREAITLLVKRWHHKLLRQANRHLFNSEVSKDVVQECWQAIIKGIVDLKEPSKFGVWALSITSRKSIDWIRKKQSSRSRAKDDLIIQEEYEDGSGDEKEQKLNAISSALNDLPLDQRIVLSMFYLESHPIAEIASILSLPIGTIKSRLYHSREHLKKILLT